MAITAAQVKELREATGAGMMDCKKALTETNGDMDAAVEVLRKKGQAKAEKKASRIAAEGICLIAQNGDQEAAVVEVNSETDFVAQNEKFRTYVAKVAEQALKTASEGIDAFMEEPWIDDAAKTVKDSLVDMISVISEKLSIRRFQKVVAEDGCVVSYLHGKGRIAVIIDAKTDVVNDAVKEALTNVAMQVAAMSPKYVSVDDVPEDFKEHEKEILLAQAIEENEKLPENKRKPQNIIEKMLIGRLNKELKQICLYDQVYVRAEDGKQTVAQYLKQVGKENGTDITVRRFVRFETGEGIEKKVENFAEEVMSQIKH
ncbi:MAG: elongation factor Ts [Lachnospiraceae bacterium]|nr:elongation factor Ts [Lachnospiraceae bacterium]MDO4408013.1 translation elongation factor Ts [Eubacteriales bacterium]